MDGSSAGTMPWNDGKTELYRAKNRHNCISVRVTPIGSRQTVVSIILPCWYVLCSGRRCTFGGASTRCAALDQYVQCLGGCRGEGLVLIGDKAVERFRGIRRGSESAHTWSRFFALVPVLTNPVVLSSFTSIKTQLCAVGKI